MSFRGADEGFAMLFSSAFAFSEHLIKWEDDRLRDKYCVCSIEVRPMQRNYSVRKSGRN